MDASILDLTSKTLAAGTHGHAAGKGGAAAVRHGEVTSVAAPKKNAVAPTMLFPIDASGDNVYVAQPIAQTYLVAARAVAASMLYRFSGLNTGFGMPDACWIGKRAELTAAAALEACPSPLHTIQTVLAEWLLVFAAMPAGSVTMVQASSPAALTAFAKSQLSASGKLSSVKAVYTSAKPLLRYTATGKTQHAPATTAAGGGDDIDMASIAAGRAVVTLSALVPTLLDWCGAILPVCDARPVGDVAGVVGPQLGRLRHLQVSTYPAGSPVREWLARGMAMGDRAFLTSLAPVLSGRAISIAHAESTLVNPFPCRLIVTRLPEPPMANSGGSDGGDRTCDEPAFATRAVSRSTSGSMVFPAADALIFYGPEDETRVPLRMVCAQSVAECMYADTTAVIITGCVKSRNWWPVLSAAPQDDVLGYVPLVASAYTLVQAALGNDVAASASNIGRVERKLRVLYPRASKEDVLSALAKVMACYAGSVRPQTAGAEPAAPVPSQPQSKVADDERTTKSHADGGAKQARVSTSEPASTQPATTPAANPDDETRQLVYAGRCLQRQGPALLTLAWIPDNFIKIATAVATVTEYFTHNGAVYVRDDSTSASAMSAATADYIANTHILYGQFTPDGRALRATHTLAPGEGSVYSVTKLGVSSSHPQVTVDLRDAVVLTPLPFWGAVLNREDLLAIALGPKTCKDLLRALWAQHVTVAHSAFDDSVSQRYIDMVCSDDSEALVLQDAPTWAPDAILTLNFRGEDERPQALAPGEKKPSELLFALEDAMHAAPAVADYSVSGKQSASVLGIGVKDRGVAITVTEQLKLVPASGQTASHYVRVPVTPALRLDATREVYAWSEPFVRTLGLTTTQVAVLASRAPSHVIDALMCILGAQSGYINAQAIRDLVADSRAEIMYKLKRRRSPDALAV